MSGLVGMVIGAALGVLLTAIATANLRSERNEAREDARKWREDYKRLVSWDIPLQDIQSDLADCQNLPVDKASLACEFFRAFPAHLLSLLNAKRTSPLEMADQQAVQRALHRKIR